MNNHYSKGVGIAAPPILSQPLIGQERQSNDNKIMPQSQRHQLEQFRQPQQQQQQQQKWNVPVVDKMRMRTPAEKEKELREMLQKRKQDLKDKEAERDRMLLRISENTAKPSSGDIANSMNSIHNAGDTQVKDAVKSVIIDTLAVDDDDEGEAEAEAEEEEEDDWLADPQVDEDDDEDDNSLNVSNTSDSRPPINYSSPFTPSISQPPVSRHVPVAVPVQEEEVSFNSRGERNTTVRY